MRAIQVFSSRFRMPAIVAVLLACSLGSAQAAVVFFETLSDAVINPVVGKEFTAHYFNVSQGGIYRATITDLSGTNAFYDEPFDTLEMQITDNPTTTTPVDAVGGVAEFTALAAGSFAAVVKATSGFGGTAFSGYEVRVALIPEPAVWLMLVAGLGLLGFVRLRRAAHNGV